MGGNTYTCFYPIVLRWDFQFGLPAEIVAAARILVQQRLRVVPLRVTAVVVHVVIVCYTLGHHPV